MKSGSVSLELIGSWQTSRGDLSCQPFTLYGRPPANQLKLDDIANMIAGETVMPEFLAVAQPRKPTGQIIDAWIA